MTRSRDEMLLLMAYAEGELADASSAQERARAEAILASDADARALVADLTSIAASTHEWVNEAAHASGPDGARANLMSTFDIADAVMAGISAGEPSVRAPIDLAARRRANAARTTGILATLAVAAAALFVVHARSGADSSAQNGQLNTPATALIAPGNPGTADTTATLPVGPVDPNALAENMPTAAPTAAIGNKAGEIEVNSVGARNHDVTVFYPQAGDTTASVVVWIDDANP